MRITAKRREFRMLGNGVYVGKIMSIQPTTIKSSDMKNGEYNDETPQLEIKLDVNGKNIKAWLMTQGYEKFEEFTAGMNPKQAIKYKSGGLKGYAVLVATNTRVVSAEETEKCEEIIANFAASAGVEEGEEVELEDLVGREIGFRVADGNDGNSRVKAFYDKEYAETLIAKESTEESEDDEA